MFIFTSCILTLFVAPVPAVTEPTQWAAIAFEPGENNVLTTVTIVTSDGKSHTSPPFTINSYSGKTARAVLVHMLTDIGWNAKKVGDNSLIIFGVGDKPIKSIHRMKFPNTDGTKLGPYISHSEGVKLLDAK